MPITSIGSYIPTTGEFAVNWGQANSELGAAPLKLAGGYIFTQFSTDREALISLMSTVSDKASASRAASTARDTVRNDLLLRLKQFRGTVKAWITNSQVAQEIPAAPNPASDAAKFREPFLKTADLWSRINAAPGAYGLNGDLVIAGSYDLDSFHDDIGAIVPNYDAVTSTGEAESAARTLRDNAMSAIYTRMKQYRAILPTLLPANSPAVMSLPRLTPAPGTTPPPLGVTGVWDNTLVKARLTWPVTTASDASKLQVRGCTGGVYKNNNEEIVADLPATATQWEGDWALTVAGSVASFKVYVMTTTGNENGGKAVRIVRPMP